MYIYNISRVFVFNIMTMLDFMCIVTAGNQVTAMSCIGKLFEFILNNKLSFKMTYAMMMILKVTPLVYIRVHIHFCDK